MQDVAQDANASPDPIQAEATHTAQARVAFESARRAALQSVLEHAGSDPASELVPRIQIRRKHVGGDLRSLYPMIKVRSELRSTA